MKLLSLFSGIGAFEKALENLNIDYELVGYSEIDKYASKAYSLIHDESESKNLGDITKINVNTLPKDIDMITYGFPCQDISIAGNQQGFFNDQGEKTQSGLFFNALNIIQAVHPKIAIAENVKNLTGKRFKNEFEMVLNSLCLAGYNNYYKVLNAKDYGIPQNRERVFIVSIREDIDTKNFEFPESIELNKRLKDMLEGTVDEKYYIKNVNMTVINDLFDSADRLLQIGTLDIKGQDNIKRVYSSEGISPTLTNMQGGNRQPKIATKKASGNEKVIVASRGRYVNTNNQTVTKQQFEINNTGCTNALTTVQKDNYVLEDPFKIRKLTPRECFRLMGFDDRDVDILIDNNISNTQLYKMAGNSICVSVLEYIFSQLSQSLLLDKAG